MDPKLFEKECLRWALDGDTVQNLLIEAEKNYGFKKEEAFTIIGDLAKRGYFSFETVEPDELTFEYVMNHLYTYMRHTEKTLERLRELN